LGDREPLGAAVAETQRFSEGKLRTKECAVEAMNLYVWLPALFALGLAVMGLMFAFVAGCDKV
jgi:hypothetical protein